MILVTGSSGYVASVVVASLKKNSKVIGIDVSEGASTDISSGIHTSETQLALTAFEGQELTVVNLAAARFDFGATALEYLQRNVEEHKRFLELLTKYNVKKFIHFSSVAAFDGARLSFDKGMGCDDAYRATKFLQEELIIKWAAKNNISLYVLYPSAIFSGSKRMDTNIGKLRAALRWLPFFPSIPQKKSLTYLENIDLFLNEYVITGAVPAGQYLTIEYPVLSVTDIMKWSSRGPKGVVYVPGLRVILLAISKVLWFFGGFGKFDMKLTPNRVHKLFSATEYVDIPELIDAEAYKIACDSDLRLILRENSRG